MRKIILCLILIFCAISLNAQNEFITTWKTDNPGFSNDDQIKIVTISEETYNYNVDWGDGKSDTGVITDITHTYTEDLNYDGDNDNTTYTITITGTYPRNTFRGLESDKLKLLTIEQWGTNPWTSMEYAFNACENLTITNATIDSPNLSNVTSLYGVFEGCYKFNGDVSGWNVSTIEEMSYAFYECYAFNGDVSGWNVENTQNFNGMFSEAYVFNQDLSGWDVSNAISMNSMFYAADAFKSDISGWNVSNVVNMTSMFYDADDFNSDISGWDVSNVVRMSSMFSRTKKFNQNISGWDISNITNMRGMFSSAIAFNQDISIWDVSNVENMNSMFYGALAFNQNISTWDVSNVVDMSSMFNGATNFNQNIGNWNIGNVQNMWNMFKDATAFDQNLGNWDIGAVTNTAFMFLNAGLSTSNYDKTLMGWATDSSGNFTDGIDDIPTNIIFEGGTSKYCYSEILRDELINTHNWSITDSGQDPNCINGFATTWKTDNLGTSDDNQITIPTYSGETYNYNVDWGDGNSNSGITTDITHTYIDDPNNPDKTYTVTITGTFPRIYFNYGDDREKILTVEHWGDYQWTSMGSAFAGCSNLNLDTFGAPDLTNVSDVTSMFSGCTSLNSDLNHWNIGTVSLMSYMFYNATSFNGGISSWNVSGVINMQGLFEGATAFNSELNLWNVSNVVNMYLMFKGATSFNQDINLWNVSNVDDMASMFNDATAFNQDISSWNVGNVYRMDNMFQGATVFDQNLGDWNLTSMTQMSDMFLNSRLSTTNYDATLMGWATDSSGTQGDGNDDIPSNITFNGGNSMYCISESLRDNLINEFYWNITDNGLNTECTNGFITTWKTNNPGPTNNNQIIISTFSNLTYNYTIDWGDGKSDTGVMGDITHTYTLADDPNYDNDGDNTTYTVTITGLFPGINFLKVFSHSPFVIGSKY